MALVTSLARQVALVGQGGNDQLLVVLALVGIAGFVVWMLFFSGNGTIQDFIKDLTTRPNRNPKDPFPVPQFDKSKLEIPRAPKAVRKPPTYRRTPDEIDFKLDNWARDLKNSLKEVRAESQWLIEKYKDVPLKRPKPETSKSSAKKEAPKKGDAKPNKAKAAPLKPKAKPSSAKIAPKSVKKSATSAKSKAPKGKR